MLITPGLAVSEMSGKFGGVVAAHNRGGQYFRQFRVPTDPQSTRQVEFRGYMTQSIQDWAALTQAQKDAWDNYAANTPWRNALGAEIFLTGMQMFIRSNVIALQTIAEGAGDVSTPITTTSNGGLPEQLTFGAVTLDVSAGASIGYADTADWCDLDGSVCILSMGRPRKATEIFDGSPKRFLAIIEGNSVTPPTSPETVATANLPWDIQELQRVSIYARILHVDGTLSSFIKTEVTVTDL